MLLCAGAAQCVGLFIVAMMIKFKQKEYITYLTLPYMLNHAIATVCVYKEWVPDDWKLHPKENAEM